MFTAPSRLSINFYFVDEWFAFAPMSNWNCEPGSLAIRSFYPISIPPTMFVELNIIEIDKYIGLLHLIEEAEPGEIPRLQYRDGICLRGHVNLGATWTS